MNTQGNSPGVPFSWFQFIYAVQSKFSRLQNLDYRGYVLGLHFLTFDSVTAGKLFERIIKNSLFSPLFKKKKFSGSLRHIIFLRLDWLP